MMVDEVLEELPRQLRYVTHRIWFYVNDDARCFIVAPRGPSGVTPIRFCLNDNRNYEDLYKKVLLFLKNNILTWTYEGWDVLFQVAPLVKNTSIREPVQICRWLPVELNYVKPGAQGSRGWVNIERPPLTQVIEEVRQKMKARPALVIDSSTGYHLYFQVNGELNLDEFKIALSYVTALLEGEAKPHPNRLMRLPGTIHPETGRLAKVIWESDDTVDFVWLLSEASTLAGRKRKREGQKRLGAWM